MLAMADQPVPIYHKLSYYEFLHRHLIPNEPLLLVSSSTSHWRARSTWRVNPDSPSRSSQPNLTGLRAYPHHVVPVADTSKRQYSEFERTERPLGEVLDLWEKGEGEGLYVKDWHLSSTIEGEGRGVEEVYEVPEPFRDNWMNSPYSASPITRQKDHRDFRFCYLGPAGTFTPLHRDVYASYSWSANIVGRKMWWLFPPDRIDRLRGKNGELPFDVQGLPHDRNGLKVLQQEGEVIFVPSGWYHQVVNLDFCISINHNFASSATLLHLYTALDEAQARVEESISDVRDMIRQRLGTETDEWEIEWCEEVQGLLERDAGWGWNGFWDMVRDNLRTPPADEGLRPPKEMTTGWIRDVIQKYKGRKEWDLLSEVREMVGGIEASLARQEDV